MIKWMSHRIKVSQHYIFILVVNDEQKLEIPLDLDIQYKVY